MFDSGTSIGAVLEIAVPGITKHSMEKIHQASILFNVFFSEVVFVIICGFFRTAIKTDYVGVLLLKEHTI